MSGKRTEPPRRIRTKLVVSFSLVFGVALAVIELVNILGFPFTAHTGRWGQQRSEAFRTLDLIADLKKERIQRWLEERRADAEVMAHNKSLRDGVVLLQRQLERQQRKGEPGSVQWERVRQGEPYAGLVASLREAKQANRAYVSLEVADAGTAKVILSTDDARLGTSVAARPFFIGALRSREDYVSDIEMHPHSGYPVLHISHVIKCRDVHMAAVLVVSVDANAIIKPMLHTGTALGRQGEALLVNREVQPLTSLGHKLVNGTTPRPLKWRVKARPAQLAAKGEEGIIEDQDYRGEQVLASYRHIRVTSEFGWGLVVKRDRAELFAPMWRSITHTCLAGVAAILLMTGVIVIIARSLSRPLMALSSTARRVEAGDLTARAPVASSDEVGALAATFNSMVQQIQHWHEELEGQVKARTDELRSLNEELRQENAERRRAEQELSSHRDHLEEQVEQRTAGLKQANDKLQQEIAVRREAEQQLAQAMVELKRSNEDLQQFAYVASHDMQEPLRMVSSYTQLLARRYKGRLDDDADDFIGFAVDGAKRMQQVIADLLAYSRVGAGHKPAEEVDCQHLLRAVQRDLRGAMEKTGAKVVHGHLPTVMGNRTQLQLLLQNLIGNAIKFCGEAPPLIKISAHREPGQWIFSVQDNGIGIEPQHTKRIFTIFQRLHTRDKYPGTGIGLAICRKIVERHDGRIWVESKPPGGATFHFTIPISEEQTRESA